MSVYVSIKGSGEVALMYRMAKAFNYTHVISIKFLGAE